MALFPPTIILRHRKENLKKCSLSGLEKRSDMTFLRYPKDPMPDLTNYVVLTLNAPMLSMDDSSQGLCLIDGTWRYAADIEKTVGPCIKRSLPPLIRTAYPRYQTLCPDPETGLASIEALFFAYSLLGRDPRGLLDNYYWKKDFIEKNSSLFPSDFLPLRIL